jgi:hypothetical protein
MLSESNLIDQVNPFLSNMPGAWSKPYQYDGYMKMEDDYYSAIAEPEILGDIFYDARES